MKQDPSRRLLCVVRSFISLCNPQHLEDRQEVSGMIQALTEALVQPLETPEPERLQLLLVMEEDKQEEVLKSHTALRRVFEGDSDQETFHGFQDEDMDD